ncbi:MAG: hypothetical protein AAF513_00870 [Pseudomonadota bacterium]
MLLRLRRWLIRLLEEPVASTATGASASAPAAPDASRFPDAPEHWLRMVQTEVPSLFVRPPVGFGEPPAEFGEPPADALARQEYVSPADASPPQLQTPEVVPDNPGDPDSVLVSGKGGSLPPMPDFPVDGPVQGSVEPNTAHYRVPDDKRDPAQQQRLDKPLPVPTVPLTSTSSVHPASAVFSADERARQRNASGRSPGAQASTGAQRVARVRARGRAIPPPSAQRALSEATARRRGRLSALPEQHISFTQQAPSALDQTRVEGEHDHKIKGRSHRAISRRDLAGASENPAPMPTAPGRVTTDASITPAATGIPVVQTPDQPAPTGTRQAESFLPQTPLLEEPSSQLWPSLLEPQPRVRRRRAWTPAGDTPDVARREQLEQRWNV